MLSTKQPTLSARFPGHASESSPLPRSNFRSPGSVTFHLRISRIDSIETRAYQCFRRELAFADPGLVRFYLSQLTSFVMALTSTCQAP